MTSSEVNTRLWMERAYEAAGNLILISTSPIKIKEIRNILRCREFFKKNKTIESDFVFAALPYVKRPCEYATYWEYLVAIRHEANAQLNTYLSLRRNHSFRDRKQV